MVRGQSERRYNTPGLLVAAEAQLMIALLQVGAQIVNKFRLASLSAVAMACYDFQIIFSHHSPSERCSDAVLDAALRSTKNFCSECRHASAELPSHPIIIVPPYHRHRSC